MAGDEPSVTSRPASETGGDSEISDTTPPPGVFINVGPAWSIVSSSPWLLVLFVLGAGVIVTRTYQRIRWAALAMKGHDPVRRFSGGARSAVMARAGRRCEHHYLYRWRCPETSKLEADHIHPHSPGGSTTVGNGQALCKRHNSLKGARIPFVWELRLLSNRRARYFPATADVTITRRDKAAATTTGQAATRQ